MPSLTDIGVAYGHCRLRLSSTRAAARRHECLRVAHRGAQRQRSVLDHALDRAASWTTRVGPREADAGPRHLHCPPQPALEPRHRPARRRPARCRGDSGSSTHRGAQRQQRHCAGRIRGGAVGHGLEEAAEAGPATAGRRVYQPPEGGHSVVKAASVARAASGPTSHGGQLKCRR